ncbi:MAG: rffA [Cyanobacteria bacterium RYN_339]|nr:rffA [Cyanobacteria bacterium RYN_339]
MRIPFNRPHASGRELTYIQEAIDRSYLSGNGPFTARCEQWLQGHLDVPRVLLTHSCTAALEMAALLADVGPGDEVIMPSYTFVSTANAFVLRGATPVFVDVRPDTQNLDAALIEAAITPRTKVIVPVHYAGVGCDMEMIGAIARRHDLVVIEDAAQALMASYQDRPLGTFGHMAAFSFHETKNVVSGEGGALVLNDPRLVQRAEILREKGTNRSQFIRGQVDKYTWVDVGSSYIPSDILAAFLFAQLEEAQAITDRRLELWERYHEAMAPFEAAGLLRRPVIPADCRHNAHMYYVVLADAALRNRLLDRMVGLGIGAVFHYVPLHSSPAGLRYARAAGELPHTVAAGERLLRLPLWLALGAHQDEIIAEFSKALAEAAV